MKDKSAFFEQMLGVPAEPSSLRSFILSPTQQPCHTFYNKLRLPPEIGAGARSFSTFVMAFQIYSATAR